MVEVINLSLINTNLSMTATRINDERRKISVRVFNEFRAVPIEFVRITYTYREGLYYACTPYIYSLYMQKRPYLDTYAYYYNRT